MEVEHNFFKLFELKVIRKLTQDQLLFQRINVIIELLDFTLEPVPHAEKVIKLAEKVRSNLKQSFEWFWVVVYFLIIFFYWQVDENLLLSHLLQVIVDATNGSVQLN